MNDILITTSSFDTDIEEIKELEEKGYKVTLNPHGRRLKEEDLLELVGAGLVGVIAGVEPWGSPAMQKSPDLKVISRCGIGMDSVDLDAAAANDIAVLNTPDAPTRAVAELTIGLILSTLRLIPQQDQSIKSGGWERPMGRLLYGKTLGLIGYGRIGRMTADIARAFGAQIIFHDPFVEDSTAMDKVITQADILSLHIPYSDENHHIIGAEQLRSMKESAVLINASRGGLVDEGALAEALHNGKLSAAGLDVFEEEPYTGPLKDLPNVVLTGHTGSYAKEARQEQERLAAKNLLEALTKTG